MAPVIKLSLWLIILKDTLLTLWMLYWSHRWICDLEGNRWNSVMAGIFAMGITSHRAWIFHPITLIFQTCQRVWSKFSRSETYGQMTFTCTAKPVMLKPHSAVPNRSWISNQTSRKKGLLFRRLLKQLDIYASFCRSSIVNSNSSSFFGEPSKGISVRIVITHFRHFRQISQLLLHLLSWKPSDAGSFVWSIGWMPIAQAWKQRMPKHR